MEKLKWREQGPSFLIGHYTKYHSNFEFPNIKWIGLGFDISIWLRMLFQFDWNMWHFYDAWRLMSPVRLHFINASLLFSYARVYTRNLCMLHLLKSSCRCIRKCLRPIRLSIHTKFVYIWFNRLLLHFSHSHSHSHSMSMFER